MTAPRHNPTTQIQPAARRRQVRRRTTRRTFTRGEISGLLDWITVADDAVLEGDPGKAHHSLLAARGWLLAKRS